MTTKLTKAQITLLAQIVAAGEAGMVVPGTLGTPARILRKRGLVEYVDKDEKPPKQRATSAGRNDDDGKEVR